MPDPLALSFVFVAIAFAGGVKGVFGIGFPTTAIALSSLVIDPRLAVILVTLPILSTNSLQIFFGPNPLDILRRYWKLLALMIPIALVAAYGSTQVPVGLLSVIIALMIVAFALVSMTQWAPRIPPRLDGPAQLTTGAVSGVVAGLTLLWAPPMMVYLLSRRVDRKELIGVLGLTLGLGTVPVLVGYLANGNLDAARLTLSALLVPVALIPQVVGELIGRRIAPERFRRYLLRMFLIFGLVLLVRGVFF